jgi:ketosteroid isomerase-like protein
MSQENVEALRRGLVAWNSGDYDGWIGPAHPDIEWVSAIAQRLEGAGAVYRGISGLRRFWEEWHGVWDFRLDATEMRDLGDSVLVLGRISATGRVSGVDTEGPLALVVTFEDGLVVRMHSYPTTDDALEAVGLSDQDVHADS